MKDDMRRSDNDTVMPTSAEVNTIHSTAALRAEDAAPPAPKGAALEKRRWWVTSRLAAVKSEPRWGGPGGCPPPLLARAWQLTLRGVL